MTALTIASVAALSIALAGCADDAPVAPAVPAPPAPTGSADVAAVEGALDDAARGRAVPYRTHAPVAAPGPAPVVVLSHGGTGNARGHTRAGHLGRALAGAGFVAVHVGHLPSPTLDDHLSDRPGDVGAVLDALAAEALALPAGFVGEADLERVGHVGHSLGAYTSHAVGGALFDGGRFHRDARIDAIVPISPQGPGRFGAFDRGPDDSTWSPVTLPAHVIVGEREIDSAANGRFIADGWRLTPFRRYPGVADTFLSVLGERGHEDLWEGDEATRRFVAAELVRFFGAYLGHGAPDAACAVGTSALDGATVRTEREAGTADSALGGCP